MVTGATGTLGRLLIPFLVEKGIEVHALSRNGRPDSVEEHGQVHWHQADAENFSLASSILDKVSTVFHLAACKKISSRALHDFYKGNVQYTLSLLHALEESKSSAHIVYTSSALVYEYAEGLISEEDPIGNPRYHGSSKLAAEFAIRAYCKENQRTAVIARCSNIYGGVLEADTVIGRILTRSADEEDIELYSLRPIRDFIHVNDVMEGLWKLSGIYMTEGTSKTVNLSTGRATSISEITKIVGSLIWKYEKRPMSFSESESADGSESSLVLDNSRLLELVNWSPKITIEEGLYTLYLSNQNKP